MVMYLTLDKGTMFGGKSSRLHEYYLGYKEREDVSLLVLKHRIDTRYSTDHIVTHDGRMMPCTAVETLSGIDPSVWDVIIIDEGQFFHDLYTWVSTHFYTCDTIVHIAGLNGDKRRNSFGDINRLSPFCSEERVHYGRCIVCDAPAPFTSYRGDDDSQIVVGSDMDYYTVCINHLCGQGK